MTSPWIDYDYAVVRLVPSVCRGGFCNVGVVLHARTAGFLGLRLHRDDLATRCAPLDPGLVERYFQAYERICAGEPSAGPIALLPPSERFHWLTAPRSAALQTSSVHAGRTRDPKQALDTLFAAHVAPLA